MSVKEEKINGYLENVCEPIKNKRVHSEIKLEIKSHLNELEKNYEKNGLSEDEAVGLALKDCGNPNDIGKNLNNIHKAGVDFKLIIIVCVLIIFGFAGINDFNAAYGGAYIQYLEKDISWAGLGAVVFIIGSVFDFRRIKKYSILLYIIGIGVSLFYCIAGNPGGKIAGTNGSLSLQVIPLVPYMFLFALSSIYMKINWKRKTQQGIALILGLVPLIMMILATKFIPMYLYFSIALIALIYINSKNKFTLIITGFLEIIIFFITSMPTLNGMITGAKWKFSLIENMLIQSKFIGSSGGSSSSLGLNYSILNVIYNCGWLIGIIIICIFIYFIWRLIRVAHSTKSKYGKSIATSIVTVISVEIIWSILMNLNILPFANLPMVFVSYGEYSMLLNLFLVGLVINIYKGRTITE